MLLLEIWAQVGPSPRLISCPDGVSASPIHWLSQVAFPLAEYWMLKAVEASHTVDGEGIEILPPMITWICPTIWRQ